MAVPKKKTSKSRQGKRRSHHAVLLPNCIKDKDSGEFRLSHRVDHSTGEYRKRKIIDIASSDTDDSEE